MTRQPLRETLRTGLGRRTRKGRPHGAGHRTNSQMDRAPPSAGLAHASRTGEVERLAGSRARTHQVLATDGHGRERLSPGVPACQNRIAVKLYDLPSCVLASAPRWRVVGAGHLRSGCGSREAARACRYSVTRWCEYSQSCLALQTARNPVKRCAGRVPTRPARRSRRKHVSRPK